MGSSAILKAISKVISKLISKLISNLFHNYSANSENHPCAVDATGRVTLKLAASDMQSDMQAATSANMRSV